MNTSRNSFAGGQGRPLRFRLMIWNALVVVLTAVVTLVGVRHGVRFTILNEMDQILIEDLYEIEYKLVDAGTTSADIRAAVHGQGNPATQRILDDLMLKARGHEHHGWFVELHDETGMQLWTSESASTNQEDWPEAANFQPFSVDGLRIVRNRQTTRGFSPLSVLVGASTDFLVRDMARIDRLVATAGGVVLLIAPAVGYWLAGRATRPLSDIIRTTAGLRPAQLEERLSVRGTGDELDQLAITVNGLLDRIGDYLAKHRDFLANSAHELRSPLAAIRSSVEVASGSKRTAEQYQELLCDVIEECGRLESLVNQLLLLAEAEGDRLEPPRKPTDLSAVVERAVDMFRAVAESREIELHSRREPAVFVAGHPHHLRQLVNNLIDNAVKFTPPGGRVDVDIASAENSQAVLTVRDSGIGVPLDDQPRVFERFFRGDRARSHDESVRGTGLGLSICQAVVTAFGGRILLESSPGQGTTVTVHLPTVSE